MALFQKKAPAGGPEGGAPGRRAADRTAARPLTTDAAVSPFLADHTRGGLNDRLAELNRRRGDWVLVSVGLLVCLLVSLGMNAYQAVRTHLIPFKVVVDGNDGYLLESGPLEPMTGVEDVYIRRELREVITGLRTVTGDRAATRAQFDRAWFRIRNESDAYNYLADLFTRDENNPMRLVGRGQRTVVEFLGPARLEGTDTWTFDWVERSALVGIGVTQDRYRGSMVVDIRPARDLATIERNPLGVWITGIQWEKVSSEILDLQDLEGGSPLDLLYPDQRGTTPARPRPATPDSAAGPAAPGASAPGSAATAPGAAPTAAPGPPAATAPATP